MSEWADMESHLAKEGNEPGLLAVLRLREPASRPGPSKQGEWRMERGGSLRGSLLPQRGERQFLNTYSKFPLIFVSSRKQENIICCSPRWQKGPRCCSDRSVTDPSPKEQRVIRKKEALPAPAPAHTASSRALKTTNQHSS